MRLCLTVYYSNKPTQARSYKRGVISALTRARNAFRLPKPLLSNLALIVQAEDWSSYEASETAYPVRQPAAANPMLRRNQYWV